ncbi:MAG: ferritin family protein [Desulfobulbaceae bacterium]|nr:ferritin family protein [Desulfobulbaceae bacterium]
MSTASDVLKNALANEVKAAAFYNLASRITVDDEARMLFIELAGLEEDHAREFLKKAEGTELLEGFDADAYLAELEKDMHEVAKSSHSEMFEKGDMTEVLNFAIDMEAHARDTYQVMASMVDNPAIKRFCNELAAEEESHRKMLDQARTSLAMDEEDRPAL